MNWILTIFLIIYGGRIVGGAIGLLRDEERESRIRLDRCRREQERD